MSKALSTVMGLVLALGPLAMIDWPEVAPGVVMAALILGFRPMSIAWRAAEGTAMRPAVSWAMLAVALGVAGQVVAMTEPIDRGRPWCGHLVYGSSLAMLAALISVYNARRPGSGAWAILMGLLVLVFLIPWLEGIGLARRADPMDRLRLEAPWSWFFALLAMAGAGNYLPTRYGPAAALAMAALELEVFGLAVEGLSLESRAMVWTASSGLLAAAIGVAGWRANRGQDRDATDDLARLWFRFRDHWGVVWAVRVADRFNQTATESGWPARLGWHGPEPVSTEAPDESAPDQPRTAEDVTPPAGFPPEATTVFKSLLRRFVSPRTAETWRDNP